MSAALASTARNHKARTDLVSLAMGTWSGAVYVFLFLPILFVVIYSFNSGRRLQIWGGFGTDWYGRALVNEGIRTAISISIQVALLSAVVSVVLGSMAGIAMARRRGGWTKPFLVLLIMILVTPEIVDGIALLIWFVRVDMDLPLARYVVGHSVVSSAVVTLIVRARLQGLDESLEEAAADLGATPWRAFRQITLPLMLPAVISGGLLAFTFSLDDVIISSFVSSAGEFTLPVYILSSLRTGLKGDIAAVSTLMLLVTIGAVVLAVTVLRRSGDSAEGATRAMAPGT